MRARSAMVLALTVAAVPAFGQSRPSTTVMTCAQAGAAIRAQGVLVLGTGTYTYDRYVSDRRYCQATEELRPAFVPARDTPSCFVGYTCAEPNRRSAGLRIQSRRSSLMLVFERV